MTEWILWTVSRLFRFLYTLATLSLPIERLREEGTGFWKEKPKQLPHWISFCDESWRSIDKLGERCDLKKQNLSAALREFFHEFKHSTERIYQMLYEVSGHREIDTVIRWLDSTFRLSCHSVVWFQIG